MSDTYRIICTVEEVDSPREIAEKVIKWLQEREIIETELSNCVLGLNDFGYKPGKHYLDVVLYDEDILRLTVCGIETKMERQVFNAMGFTALTEMLCPNCRKNRFEGITPQDFYMDNLSREQLQSFHAVFDVFDSWVQNEKAELKCPHCKETALLSQYKIGDTISLSNFGITFWNWPEFKPVFVEQLREIIDHDIKMIVGRI